MRKFVANQSGASLVEYGLLVGLIAIVAIAAVTTLGEKVSAIFNAIANKLNAVTASLPA